MLAGKTLIIAIVTLVVGFIGGFLLRPVLAPPSAVAPSPTVAAASAPTADARGTQYFAAHVEEARRIVARCRDGSVRGDECANAEQAVTEAEGRDRFKKFMGH